MDSTDIFCQQLVGACSDVDINFGNQAAALADVVLTVDALISAVEREEEEQEESFFEQEKLQVEQDFEVSIASLKAIVKERVSTAKPVTPRTPAAGNVSFTGSTPSSSSRNPIASKSSPPSRLKSADKSKPNKPTPQGRVASNNKAKPDKHAHKARTPRTDPFSPSATLALPVISLSSSSSASASASSALDDPLPAPARSPANLDDTFMWDLETPLSDLRANKKTAHQVELMCKGNQRVVCSHQLLQPCLAHDGITTKYALPDIEAKVVELALDFVSLAYGIESPRSPELSIQDQVLVSLLEVASLLKIAALFVVCAARLARLQSDQPGFLYQLVGGSFFISLPDSECVKLQRHPMLADTWCQKVLSMHWYQSCARLSSDYKTHVDTRAQRLAQARLAGSELGAPVSASLASSSVDWLACYSELRLQRLLALKPSLVDQDAIREWAEQLASFAQVLNLSACNPDSVNAALASSADVLTACTSLACLDLRCLRAGIPEKTAQQLQQLTSKDLRVLVCRSETMTASMQISSSLRRNLHMKTS